MAQISSKDQLRSLSIFNFTAKEHLPYAFDRLSEYLSTDMSKPAPAPIDLLANLPNNNCALHVHLVRTPAGNEGASSSNRVSDYQRTILLVTLAPAAAASGTGTPVLNSERNFVLPNLQPVAPVCDQQPDQQQSLIKPTSGPLSEGTAFFAFG